jgi:hypothetical protein
MEKLPKNYLEGIFHPGTDFINYVLGHFFVFPTNAESTTTYVYLGGI